jgi:hypothetical protein
MGGEISHKIEMPHPEHEKHLSYLEKICCVESHLEDYKKLAKNAKFVCGGCGRASVNMENICYPESL